MSLINSIPFGVAKIHTLSVKDNEDALEKNGYLNLITPFDWLMFNTCNGLIFCKLLPGKSIIEDKHSWMKNFFR